MKGYSRSREDRIDLLCKKYNMEEMKNWCLWLGESTSDFILCAGNEDLLPKLVKQDEIRYEYNQWNQDRSDVSCTIFAAIGMLSDLINYKFSLDEIKEYDDESYNNPKYPKIRERWHWRYVRYAVDLVCDKYNNSELAKKYGKIAYYRVSKYEDELIANIIWKLYTLDTSYQWNSKYNADYKDNWVLDGTTFWTATYGHSVDVISYKGKRSVKDNYYWRKYNIYEVKNYISKIPCFWDYLYLYTKVNEDNLEEIKKLNKIKAWILNWMPINSELRELSGSEYHKNKLHEMNDFYRDWLSYIDNRLKELS